jgi:hypothetical protein
MTPEQLEYFLLGMQCVKERLVEDLYGYRRALTERSWCKDDFDYYTSAVQVLEKEVEDIEGYIKYKEQDDT